MISVHGYIYRPQTRPELSWGLKKKKKKRHRALGKNNQRSLVGVMCRGNRLNSAKLVQPYYLAI